MFTGQIIGYVGADARQNKNGKDSTSMYPPSTRT